MKQLLVISILIVLGFSCQKNIHPAASEEGVFIVIDTVKTFSRDNGDIMLYFNIVNRTKDNIVILKPRQETYPVLVIDYFKNSMKCEDIPITLGLDAEPRAKMRIDQEKDLEIIPAASQSSTLLMSGSIYDEWLSCNSETVKLGIVYNSQDSARMQRVLGYLNADEKIKQQELLNSITQIRIESPITEVNLN